MRVSPFRILSIPEAFLFVLGACLGLTGAVETARGQTEPQGLTGIPPALITYKYAPEKFSDDALKGTLSQIIGQEQSQYKEMSNAKQASAKAHYADHFRVFAEEQVTGRAPNFAAEELLGAYKAFLAKEAAAVPDQVRIDRYLSLAYFKYENGVINSNTGSGQGANVFYRDSIEDDRKKASIQALGAHEVLLGRYPFASTLSSPGFTKLPRYSGSIQLAMDRVPTIEPVPMGRDAAEKLFIQPNECLPPGPKSDPAAVTNYKTCLEKNERYSRGFMLSYVVTPKGFVEGTDILALRVDKVELYSPYGELIKTYMPSELAAASDAFAEKRTAEERATENAAARQKQQAAANAALSARIGAADIDGLTLSMTYSQAEAVIRNKLEIGRVRQMNSADRTMPYFSDMTQFENVDGSERIMLFRARADSETLVGIGRWVNLPNGTTLDDVRDQLVAKYGEPTGTYYSNGLSWDGFADKRRTCGSRIGWVRPPRISEGEALTSYEQYGSISISSAGAGKLKNDALKAVRDECSPQLLAMVQMSRLVVVLLNVSAYAAENVEGGEPKKVKLDL